MSSFQYPSRLTGASGTSAWDTESSNSDPSGTVGVTGRGTCGGLEDGRAGIGGGDGDGMVSTTASWGVVGTTTVGGISRLGIICESWGGSTTGAMVNSSCLSGKMGAVSTTGVGGFPAQNWPVAWAKCGAP